MRIVLIAVATLVLMAGALIFIKWDSITESYKEMVAMASEVAVESGNQMGQGAYHLTQCGRPEYMEDLRKSLDQLDQVSSEFQADMKAAFDVGIEQARDANIDYTEAFCERLLAEIDEAG
jgi:hypothetical protein